MIVFLSACTGAMEPVPSPPPKETPPRREAPPPPPGPNFLVLLADDVGTDKISAYREGKVVPSTPHIDALAAEGVLFRNMYTYPICSASRSALLTGRYGRRNGMGGVIELGHTSWELPLAEVTLPEALKLGGHDKGIEWAAVAVGKWHMSGFHTPNAFQHPLLQGFDHHKGTIGNLVNSSKDYGGGKRGDYYHHERSVDGVPAWSTTYATTETADDAIDALKTMTSPWFLWVAFNAAHEPFDPPPAGLSSVPTTEADPEFKREHAMIEGMDKEIGRILEALGPQRAATTIIFLGDNGTDQGVVLPPFEPRHAKATLFEGGTGVPLIVSGPTVGAKGSETQALVHAVDLYPTLLELAGLQPPPGVTIDGTSFASVLASPSSPGPRKYVYTERFSPVGPGPYDTDQMAVRDRRYKLVLTKSGKYTFYDLDGRNDDGPLLPVRELKGEAHQHYEVLRSELERIQEQAKFEYGAGEH